MAGEPDGPGQEERGDQAEALRRRGRSLGFFLADGLPAAPRGDVRFAGILALPAEALRERFCVLRLVSDRVAGLLPALDLAAAAADAADALKRQADADAAGTAFR